MIFTPAPSAPDESVLPRRSLFFPVSFEVVSLVVIFATPVQLLKLMEKGISGDAANLLI